MTASEQCTAMSKRTKRRCGQLVPGGGVCQWHGRNDAAERNRQARIAVAEAKDLFADRFEAREWWEALPAAASLCDQLMQALRAKVELAGNLTVAELEALAQLAERTARLAKIVQDSDIDERRAKVNEQQAEQVFQLLTNVLGDLGLSLQEPRVLAVVSTRVRELSSEAGS